MKWIFKPFIGNIFFLLVVLCPHIMVSQTTWEKGKNQADHPEELRGSNQEFKALENYLDSLVAHDQFSGVVLITEKYNPVFHKSYGYASKRFDVPNRPDTKFNVGSIGKLFTSIGIMQLWYEKKLSLDDHIGKYLPEFPEGVGDKVTIRHLLQHKSGWGHYWKEEHYLLNWYDLRKVSDYTDFIKDIPLDFEPGSQQKYSNIGFEVLGAIIEKTSGMNYFQFLEKRILKPAEMYNTGAFDLDLPIKNLAIGYTNMSGRNSKGFQRNNIGLNAMKGTPAGGIYSTAEDLVRLLRAMQVGTLMPKVYTNYIMKGSYEGHLPDPKEPGYTKTFSGGGPGVSAMIFDNGGDAFIVLSNYDYPVAMKVHDTAVKVVMIKKAKSNKGKVNIKN